MVVSTAEVQSASSGQTKTKKKRPAGSSSGKSRRSQQQQQQTPNNGVHYVHPRRTVLQQVDEEDATVVATEQHLYDVVKSLEPMSNYQNVTTSEADNQQAVYQNMDDMYVNFVSLPFSNLLSLSLS